MRMRSRMARSSLTSKHERDRKSTRLNSSHGYISYAVFCLKKKNNNRLTLAQVITLSVRIQLITSAYPTQDAKSFGPTLSLSLQIRLPRHRNSRHPFDILYT